MSGDINTLRLAEIRELAERNIADGWNTATIRFLLSEIDKLKSHAISFHVNQGGPTQIGVFEIALYECNYREKWGWYWEILFTGFRGQDMISVAKCNEVCERREDAYGAAEKALLRACGVKNE